MPFTRSLSRTQHSTNKTQTIYTKKTEEIGICIKRAIKFPISMAVEARNLNHFLPQLLGNREIMTPIDGNGGFYRTQMGYFAGAPAIDGEIGDPVQMYGFAAVKSDSGVTHNHNLPVGRSRKRSRIDPGDQTQKRPHAPFSFLGDDASVQIQQAQLEIDRIVSQHMEKLRAAIEERRRWEARRVVEGIGSRLRAKEEEVERVRKLNWALEEKVQSLSMETQIWRELAQSNEAAAQSLRAQLERALEARGGEEAESCCGGGEEEEERVVTWCRSCGKEEACVLVLPCRHLCLCGVCGSTVHVCPVCRSVKNASLHVNMAL